MCIGSLRFRRWLLRIIWNWKRFPHFSRFASLNEMQEYLQKVLKQMEAAVQTATNKYAHILSIAKQYVQNNYNRDISMDEVAEMVSMSYSYFSRVFKEQLHQSFSEYVLSVRMREAKRLMEEDPAIKIKRGGRTGWLSKRVYLFQGLQAVLSCLTETGSRRLTGILPKHRQHILERNLKMEYKKLGKSDVLVSELILGCWAMGGDYFGATEDKSSLEALEVSYENGVNTFDTAEIYGDGRSERVVGEAARRIGRDKVRIISKVFKPSMSHDKMIKACEDSLQRLGTDYLDVYFLHYPVAEEEVTIQERMETMEELKKAGKIRAIGLSNFSLEEMKAAMKFGQVDVIQPCYSLLWRYDEALLEFSRKQEISVIPYSTLAQGLLTGKYQKGAVFTDGRARAALFQPENYDRCLEVTDVLSQISAKYGKTPAQGAIAWLLQTQGITAPIVGAKNGRQAQENLKAAGWQFSKEDYDVIDRASRRFMEGLPHYTLFFNTETTN